MSVASDSPDSVTAASATWAQRHHEDGRRTWLERLGSLLGNRYLSVSLVVAASLAVGLGVTAMRGNVDATDPNYIFSTVQRGELPITVTERGNLESQQNLEILCEVDDIPNDGMNGTAIVFIVPNGASVKQGELLVEFDSAGHQERLDLQILDTERARATQIQAQAKYDNQLTQNETSKADADLKVKLAELELEMFQDEKNGSHRLAVQEIERLIDDVNNEILAAQASLELKKNEMRGIESLFKLGYAVKSEVDRSRLEFLQTEGQYAAKVNRLKTQLAALTKKQTYEQQMSLLTLQGNLETAKRKLLQVDRDNEALLAQAKAALQAANEALKKEEERLVRYREQIGKCKILAPADGMVVYTVSSNVYYREEIREGAAIRPRQPILSLPNLASMQVKTSVHESVLDQIRPGLSATVRVDAFPDRVYTGVVKSVAVMPEQGGYLSSDTKVYETIVAIPETVQQVKPGMTAIVEISVERLTDVLTVPVQAVVQVNKETWCYVAEAGSVQRRPIKLGRTNDKFVEIVDGLQPGERVVLNPMTLAEEQPAEPGAGKPPAAERPADVKKPGG